MAQHLPQYLHKSGPVLELHFTIIEDERALRFDVEELFQRADSAEVTERRALVLSPEDAVLHLCDHFGNHHVFDTGIRPMVDIIRQIEWSGDRFHWETFLSRADEWRIGRSVALSLLLCEKYAGLRIPERGRAWLASQGDLEWAIGQAESVLFGSGGGIPFNLAQLFSAESGSKRARLLFGTVFSPPDRIRAIAKADTDKASPFERSLPVLYAKRLAGLWKRHGKTTLRLLRGDKASRASLDAGRTKVALGEWLRG